MNLKETFFPKIFIFAAVLCFLCGTATAQTVTIAKTFTESSSWEIPAGVTSVTIECVGGGGAGGYVHGEGQLFRNSGGGGGGAYARKVQDVSPGQTLYITVGAGGYAWASDGNQVNGGSSEVSINSVIVVKAAGGKTVKGTNTTAGASGGSVSDCIGDDVFAGGKGANVYNDGTTDLPGGGGGAAGSTGPGNSANNSNGGAARANYGGKGGDGKTYIGIGRSGENYGGGGSGSKCTGIDGADGGEGANGIVVITYDAPISMIVDNMADSICSGNSFSIVPTGTIPDGTTYTWSAPSVSGISGTASGSGSSTVNGTLINTSNHKIDVVYNVTAYYSSSVTSNFTVTVTVYALPVINSLNAADTCPENTAFYISADITSGDAPVTLYKWNSSASYGTYSADTIIKFYAAECGEKYQSTLQVKDTNGCVSDTAKLSFSTPTKPAISILSVPADYGIGKYMVPDLKDTITAAFHPSCNFLIPSSYTQDSVVGAIIAPGTTVPVKAIYKTVCNTSKFDTLVINVVAGATVPDITPADLEFDDSNDTIHLYYGFCDTLYYVNKPTYSAISSIDINDLTLSNDKSSANEGPILDRISNGEYTIVWKLTSNTNGSYVEYPKKYVVVYPPCGGTMTVTDVDGNEYETVRVGCECWTKTNLKTTTVSDTSYAYQNDDSNVAKFGRLYSWYSAVGLPKNSTSNPTTTTDPISNVTYIQGVCPSGWALPTTASYENLYLASGEDVNKLKSSTGSDWLSGLSGTDAYGFGAVGGGYYMSISPYYYDLLGEAYFWICEGDPIAMKGECSSITLSCPILLIRTFDAGMGLSVRCVKREN